MKKLKNRKTANGGYTLLEVLIVLGLLLVLISMIWSLLQVYSAYYVSGTRRVERSQLVRSISQLLSDDLHAAIQDPIHPLAPTTEADDSVRRFGLLGTNSSLRVDVIQINPLDPAGRPTAKRQAAMGPVQDVVLQVPELKTIFYDFIPFSPQTQSQYSNTQQYCGLIRREISFEMPDDSGSQPITEEQMQSTDTAAVATTRSVGNWNLDQDLHLEQSDTLFDSTLATPSFPDTHQPTGKAPTLSEQLFREDDPNRMWAPEVVDFSLRYSDGKNWLDSWDSIEKNGLPIAVEVNLTLLPLHDIETAKKSPLFLSQTLSSSGDETMDAITSEVATARSVGDGIGFVQAAPSADSNEFSLTPPSSANNPAVPGSAKSTISWKKLTQELGIAPPMEQQIVVFLAGSPLLKNEPFRRPPVPAVAKTPTPSVLTSGPTPTLATPSVAPPPVSPQPSTPPPPAAPKPTVPTQQWIRK